MVPKGSTFDISSKNENIEESQSQKDNYDKDNRYSNKNINELEGGYKRKVGGNDLDDKNYKKRILNNNVNMVSKPNTSVKLIRDAA